MEKGLILTSVASESAEQHHTKPAGALKEVRKSDLGKPATDLGLSFLFKVPM